MAIWSSGTTVLRRIKDAIFRNLGQEAAYPFYAFDPVFKGTGVADYWDQYTRELQNEAALNDHDSLKKLLVIEWFPYPSKSDGLSCKTRLRIAEIFLSACQRDAGRG